MILSATTVAPAGRVHMCAIVVKVAQTAQLSVRVVTKPAQTVKIQFYALNAAFIVSTAWTVNGVITVIPVHHVLMSVIVVEDVTTVQQYAWVV